MPDTGAKSRGKAKPPPEPARDAREHLEDWRDKKNLSGSDAAEFSFVLANQVAGALAYGADPDPVMKGTQQLAAFAALAGTRPADPLEGMLAAQMVGVHDAAMGCLRRANVPGQTFEARRMNLDMATRLSRTYATLLEALDKRRGKGQPQVVRVERVNVEAGGRAIVGAVSHPGRGGGGDGREIDGRARARALTHAPEPEVWCEDAQREPVPVAGREGQAAL
jgi:hypothetical protein